MRMLCHQIGLSVSHSVIPSVCVQNYSKSNEPTSLKLGVVIGPTNRKNWLTFNGDPVPDTDSGSPYHSSSLRKREFQEIY